MFGSVLILAWTRDIKLKTLSIKDLVVIKSRRSLIETNILSREDLVVRGSALRRPLRPCVLEVILHLVSCFTELLRTFQDLLRVVLVE